jgi:uncharacterized protein YbjT (DUF2867 family)
MGALDIAATARVETQSRTQSRSTVLVLGGAGFVGRHVVDALIARGCNIIIGTRHPGRRLRPSLEVICREVHLDRLLDPAAWDDTLRDCAAVVNCVGILRERGHETYRRVHHQAPAALAQACATHGMRLIHVSALGLEGEVRSGFLRSKRDGEAALRASTADWHIVRPSLLDGDGGFGARWIRRVARWPIHPLPRGAIGRIAVLDARDLGEAIAQLVLSEPTPPHQQIIREHDLGGPQARTLAEHLAAMRALYSARPTLRWPIPDALARIAAHVCDLLHATPLSFGHWELLQRDNCPQHNRLPLLLGRMPRSVGAAPVANLASKTAVAAARPTP